MICPQCQGRGFRPLRRAEVSIFAMALRMAHDAQVLVLCEECQGHGLVHCCEGLREQPGLSQK